MENDVKTPSLEGMTVVSVEYNGTKYFGCGKGVKQAKQAAAKYVLKAINAAERL